MDIPPELVERATRLALEAYANYRDSSSDSQVNMLNALWAATEKADEVFREHGFFEPKVTTACAEEAQAIYETDPENLDLR